MRSPARTTPLLGALGTALALLLQGALALPSAGAATVPSVAPSLASTASTTTDPAAPADNQPTTLRVSSYNLLGAGHTAPGGNKYKKGWATGPQRMTWAWQEIQKYNLDVLGFQEFEKPQRQTFASLSAGQFGVYPSESELGDMSRRDAIVWRLSQWQLVESHWINIPYFYGNPVKMPYVLLRNVQTGRLAWFFNTHNPADARGPAAKYRAEGYRLEWQLVSKLRTDYPDVPVIVTGDKNAKSPYFCPTARNSILHAANDSTATATTCTLHQPSRIDWIMGSPDVRYGNYHDIYDALAQKVSDHHLVYADAELPSVASENSPVKHVVVVSVDGLKPWVIARTTSDQTPALHRMAAEGAWTSNARTDYNTVNRRSNIVGMLTGLRAKLASGGHGVVGSRSYGTVADAAGRYVPSVFDVLHDVGLGTALVTDDADTALVRDSFSSTNGARDAWAPNDGRGKISRFVQASSDAQVASSAVGVLRSAHPAFTFVQLSEPSQVGFRDGFGSSSYRSALQAADQRIGQLLAAVDNTPALAGSTAVVVTSERGGGRRTTQATKRITYYKVPMFVTGPGVPAGASLYSLNPQLAPPGSTRPSYSTSVAQPVRTLYVANLVTKLLGWPAVPGSDQDPGQAFTVTDTASTTP